MEKLNRFVNQMGFCIMLKQSNEKGVFAVNVSVSYMAKNGLNSFEVAIASQLIDESRVGGEVVFESHFVVLSEERQGVFWAVSLFDIGDERYGLAKKLCGGSVRAFAARLGVGFVGTTEGVVGLEICEIGPVEERV